MPEFNASEFVEIANPSASESPDATVYEKTSDDVPDPDVYVANLLDKPARVIRGDPATLIFSENTTVTLIASPTLYVLSAPAFDVKLTDDTVGERVS